MFQRESSENDINHYNIIQCNSIDSRKSKNKFSYYAFCELLLFAILSIKIGCKHAKVGGRKSISYVLVLVTYIYIILRVLISPIKTSVH